MPDVNLSSYFYGEEAMRFTCFRIPCQLITCPRFKYLSTDSKLLCGMLLDRMSLAIKNEWYDDTGCVYIYYTWTRYDVGFCQANKRGFCTPARVCYSIEEGWAYLYAQTIVQRPLSRLGDERGKKEVR